MMNGIDRFVVNSILGKNYNVKDHMQKSASGDKNKQADMAIRDQVRNAIIFERHGSQIWLILKNKRMTETILKAFADDDKKKILSLAGTKSETIPRILQACNLPNTSAYRKVRQLIADGFIIPVGRADVFERRRAVLYRSTIQQIQINIDGNAVTAKILIPNEILQSSVFLNMDNQILDGASTLTN
jgi:hypothetical protein